jgi:hypothetical protein
MRDCFQKNAAKQFFGRTSIARGAAPKDENGLKGSGIPADNTYEIDISILSPDFDPGELSDG